MLKESQIKYEDRGYFVIEVAKGYEVYKVGLTHSTKCATIGYKGEEGLKRSVAEIYRRIHAQN